MARGGRLAGLVVLMGLLGCEGGKKVVPSEASETAVPCAVELASLVGEGTSSVPPAGTFQDPRDGNRYPFVRLGDRDWFATNLRFGQGSEGTWCPGGSESGCARGGVLYDWWAAAEQPRTCKDGICAAWTATMGRGACPEGWRIPTVADFDRVIQRLGGPDRAGRAMKSRTGWLAGPDGAPGTGGDDSGFAALPAGTQAPTDDRSKEGCSGLGSGAAFWTADRRLSLFEQPLAIWVVLASGTNGTTVYSVTSEAAASIRCVR